MFKIVNSLKTQLLHFFEGRQKSSGIQCCLFQYHRSTYFDKPSSIFTLLIKPSGLFGRKEAA